MPSQSKYRWEPHPLFPQEDLEDLPGEEDEREDVEIGFITVLRFDPISRQPNWVGNVVASELQDEGELLSTFGPGKYDLQARMEHGGKPHKIITRRNLTIGSPDLKIPVVDPKTGLPAAPPGAAPNGDMNVGQLMLLMIQMNQASADRAMAMQMENTKMMMSMMTTTVTAMAGRGDGGAMAALSNIASAALQQRETPTQAIMDAVQLGRQMSEGEEEPDGEESLINGIAQGMEAFSKIQNMPRPNGQGGAPHGAAG